MYNIRSVLLAGLALFFILSSSIAAIIPVSSRYDDLNQDASLLRSPMDVERQVSPPESSLKRGDVYGITSRQLFRSRGLVNEKYYLVILDVSEDEIVVAVKNPDSSARSDLINEPSYLKNHRLLGNSAGSAPKLRYERKTTSKTFRPWKNASKTYMGRLETAIVDQLINDFDTAQEALRNPLGQGSVVTLNAGDTLPPRTGQTGPLNAVLLDGPRQFESIERNGVPVKATRIAVLSFDPLFEIGIRPSLVDYNVIKGINYESPEAGNMAHGAQLMRIWAKLDALKYTNRKLAKDSITIIKNRFDNLYMFVPETTLFGEAFPVHRVHFNYKHASGDTFLQSSFAVILCSLRKEARRSMTGIGLLTISSTVPCDGSETSTVFPNGPPVQLDTPSLLQIIGSHSTNIKESQLEFHFVEPLELAPTGRTVHGTTFSNIRDEFVRHQRYGPRHSVDILHKTPFFG